MISQKNKKHKKVCLTLEFVFTLDKCRSMQIKQIADAYNKFSLKVRTLASCLFINEFVGWINDILFLVSIFE